MSRLVSKRRETKKRGDEPHVDYSSIGQLTWSHRKQTECNSYPMSVASGLLAVSDGLILLGSGFFIYWYYVGWESPTLWNYSLVMVLATITIISVFAQSDLYRGSEIFNPSVHFHRILGLLAVILTIFLAISFALKVSGQFSRVWCFSWFLSSALLICVERYVYSFLFLRWAQAGRVSQKIVIIGSGKQAKSFLKQLNCEKEPWINLVGFFDDRTSRTRTSLMGVPFLGNIDVLMGFCRNNRVDDIVVALPWSADKRLLEIIRKLEELPITVSLCSDLAGFLSLRTIYSSMGGVPMLDVVRKPLEGWGHFLKGVEDKFLGLILLILLMPLLVLIALAIKIDSKGPVLFWQKRHGFNNKEFMVTKFRSMYHERPPENGVPQAKQNDHRVTRVGAFLRRTSLDELPQLLNVLGGTMSIVGPRPHAIEHNEEYCKIINRFFSRHRVKPGITGWAQVNGYRGETQTLDKMQARYDYDVHYIENWSLFFDLRILFSTVFVLVSQKNAY